MAVDITTAVEMYYSKIVLSNADIKKLFSCQNNKAIVLKKKAKEEMIRSGVSAWNDRTVDTESAFRAWGLDIAKLESKYAKLKKLGLIP